MEGLGRVIDLIIEGFQTIMRSSSLRQHNPLTKPIKIKWRVGDSLLGNQVVEFDQMSHFHRGIVCSFLIWDECNT